MSAYHKGLVEILENPDQWAEFRKPEFLQVLDNAAHEAFQKQTLEGYLAAFLIYQQIVEDMIKNIIKLTRLFNQASVFPMIIEYGSLDNSRMTFGKLLNELQTLPHEDTELADLCKRLNERRIQLVHKLTMKESLDDIKNKCQEALEIYGKIESEYSDLENYLRITLSDYKDNSLESWKKEYTELLG